VQSPVDVIVPPEIVAAIVYVTPVIKSAFVTPVSIVVSAGLPLQCFPIIVKRSASVVPVNAGDKVNVT
jgi:hypothetical protein